MVDQKKNYGRYKKRTILSFINYHQLLILAIILFIALIYVLYMGVSYAMPVQGFYGLKGYAIVTHGVFN